MIAEVRNEDIEAMRGSRHDNLPVHFLKRHSSIIVGVALSVLIHAITFWLLIDRTPTLNKLQEVKVGDSKTLSVTLVSPSKEVSVPTKLPLIHEKKSNQKLTQESKIIPRSTAEPVAKLEQVTPSIVASAAPQISTPPTQYEFSARLEENRRRRAETQALQHDDASGQDDEIQRKNRAVLANISTSLERSNGSDQNGHGGIFQVRHVGSSNAEFIFRGWSTNLHRTSTQLVEVSINAEPDIYTAIVKKMIQIIREEKDNDFVWESHRLGREITLSARPEYDAELRHFLMLEFFPEYISVAR